LSLCAAVFATSCATTSAEGPGPAAAAAAGFDPAEVAHYYPLAVGNTWTYKGKLLGQTSERRVTVVRKNGPVYADDQQGEFMLDGEGVRDRKRYLIKGPIAKGNKWMSVASVSSVEHFEITDTGRSVSVAAGRFEGCVVVRATNRIDASKDFVTEWTYAPGVGLVKMENFILRNKKEYVPQGEFELSAYEIK
jgi:hypothetical protein